MEGTDFKDFKKQLLKDPKVGKEYDKIKILDKITTWKEIKPLTPYIGLDGKIVCDFEACPLKKNVNLLDVLKMIRKIIKNSREAPNVLDTIDWVSMKAIHDYLENKEPNMGNKGKE